MRAAREDLLLRGARYRSASARQKSEFVVPMGSDEPLLGRRFEAARPEKAVADGDGDASFVQTCLNGLNALSGVVPVLCLLQYCFLIGTMPLIDLLDIAEPIIRGWAALGALRALGRGLAEPGAAGRRGRGLLVHRPPPPALHGRRPDRPHVRRHR